MNLTLVMLLIVVVASSIVAVADPAGKALPEVLKLNVKKIDGTDVALSSYQGKVLLIVNTASRCGYTKQYAGLEKIHKEFADKGLAVLGFPANNFGGQEPGSDADIATFCETKFGVTFDMFSKVSVKGDDQSPLFKLLTGADAKPAGSGDVKWNFEKFLVSKDGTIVKRFRSAVAPDSDEVKLAIQEELAK